MKPEHYDPSRRIGETSSRSASRSVALALEEGARGTPSPDRETNVVVVNFSKGIARTKPGKVGLREASESPIAFLSIHRDRD